jgi:GT2 family glycosyltransferase
MSAVELSIVITTRNRFDELMGCIDSVSRSEFSRPFELIVIDDCSSDETAALTEAEIKTRYGLDQVVVFHSTESLKMVRARNKGAQIATGRFILFIDDDNVVDPLMVAELFRCAENVTDAGVVGPSMYMLKNQEKYLDYQTINLYTMRTRLLTGDGVSELYESDGVPNVFLVKREVFDKAGYFDDRLIQTFTEPDFSYNALRHGFRTVTCPRAKTFHNIDLSERSRHTGAIPAKAYCLMRNRFVIVKRYGSALQLLVFLTCFSWMWPLLYSLIAVGDGNLKRIPYYLAGFIDGFYYALTGRFRTRGIIASQV